MKLTRIKDVFQIAPDRQLNLLSRAEKMRLMDSVLVDSGERRGLKVDFNLSHSARVINARIYPPKGHQAGISTWMEPYPRPIIRNHDMNEDPMGRFSSVSWESLEHVAVQQIGQEAVDYLKDAYATDKPTFIYKAMKRVGVLLNKKWAGLGVLKASALITDEKSIEKFLDGRYLTFSAGQQTDRLACGICGSEWHLGDVCEHAKGALTDDGDYGVLVAGNLYGDEGSVITAPADDMGYVTNMTFTDIVPFGTRDSQEETLDAKGVSINDSQGDSMEHDVELEKTEEEASTEVVQDESSENSSVTDVQEESAEAETEVQAEVTETETVQDEVHEERPEKRELDFVLIDMALEREVSRMEGASLVEDRDSLPKDNFFKDSALCVPNLQYVKAARALFDKIALAPTQKSELLDFLSAREQAITDSKHEELLADYKQSLKQIQELKDSYAVLKAELEALKTSPNKSEDIKTVENPSFAHDDSVPTLKSKDSLNAYELATIESVRRLMDNVGIGAAKSLVYHRKSQGLISTDFDPISYLE